MGEEGAYMDANIEKLENSLGERLLEQGAYYVEYGIQNHCERHSTTIITAASLNTKIATLTFLVG